MCLELFYWFQADKANIGEIPTLTVWTVDEEKVRRKINATNKFIQDWSRFFVTLPEGINQIVIEGKRAGAGTNGIALDDVNVGKCEMFSEWNPWLPLNTNKYLHNFLNNAKQSMSNLTPMITNLINLNNHANGNNMK